MTSTVLHPDDMDSLVQELMSREEAVTALIGTWDCAPGWAIPTVGLDVGTDGEKWFLAGSIPAWQGGRWFEVAGMFACPTSADSLCLCAKHQECLVHSGSGTALEL